MAKPAKKSGLPAKKPTDSLVVGSKVKALIKANECMTSGEFLGALTEYVNWAVGKACERAKANKRSTVRPQDL
jgi:histone H3/H4